MPVSVVIPAFNAASFVEKTLDSVRAQTYTNYEVVVVDDGSSDDTCSVVQHWLERHAIAGRCIRQENKKIAGARNAGMRSARGTYIALLDHDDLWCPEKLAMVMREFELHPEVDLICHNESFTCDGKVIRISRNGPAAKNMYERLLLSGNTLSPSACVFKKDKALSIGGFRETPGFDTVEDYDFWLRLSRVARFGFIDQVLGECRMREGSASRRIEYHFTNLERVLREHFSAHFGDRPGIIATMRFRRRLSAVYRAAAGQLMESNESPEKQREYIFKMLREFPLEPKNLARFLLWAMRNGRAFKAQPE